LTIGDFDKAAQVAKNSIGPGAAYQAGSALKRLLVFLIENRMLNPFLWKNPIRKARESGTDDDAQLSRQDKMPDDNALMAIAQISSAKPENLGPRDIFTTSIMTLLLCAPSRGSEPLYLRADCIHKEKMSANRALEVGLPAEDITSLLKEQSNKQYDSIPTAFDYDDEVTLIGIRWYSGKSYGHENKWIPTVMYETVMTSIKRLQEQSLEARRFAKMLEESNDFPRHPLCPDVPDDQLLTKVEVALAFGFDISSYKQGKPLNNAVNQFLKRKGLQRKDYTVTLRDINKIIRANLPTGFPYIPFKNGEGKVKVKWSDALLAGFSNKFSTQKATINTELAIPTINTLNEDLAPTKKTNRKTGETLTGSPSVFQRWDYGDLIITSHQLRHMLDTIAAVNGMEGDIRAKWAMRSDPKHNRYYNHTTYEEYGTDFIEGREKNLALKNQLPANQIQVQVATPRTIQELNTKASLTAHTTEYGMCITSYLSEPCTKYRDCINCNEHVCTKGDDDKCDRIRQRLAREEKLLKKDENAVQNRVPGAEQWQKRRHLTVERLRQLLKMMENPELENGSLIKLSNVADVTLLDRAMDANGKKRLPDITNYQRIKSVSVDQIVTKNTSDDPQGVINDIKEL
jgi:hypothetical protein